MVRLEVDDAASVMLFGADLLQDGLILDEPRELRRHPQQPHRVEFICTFVDQHAYQLASEKWNVESRTDVFFEQDDVRVCSCRKPGTLLLRVDPLRSIAPFHCGSCLNPFPTYRLPRELWKVQDWARVYTRIYLIWLASEVLELWALSELSRLDSELNQAGYAIAQQAGAYFDLFVDTDEQGNEPPCPRCERPTHLRASWKAWVCEDCRLIGY